MTTISSPGAIVTGAPLRARRLALGLSQERLAAIVGCSRVRLSMWEGGLVPRRPTPVLARINATLTALEAEQATQAA
jgi:transcriptional regulator with XRE-family HTH domain